MNISTLPKPLVYSLSAVLLAIGFSIAYQVVVGSSLVVSGALGEIELGSNTTLEQFLVQSEVALEDARNTIDEQDKLIQQLKLAIAEYRSEVAALKTLSERLNGADNDRQRRQISSNLKLRAAELDRSALRITQIRELPTLAATKKRLQEQALLTSQIKSEIKQSIK